MQQALTDLLAYINVRSIIEKDDLPAFKAADAVGLDLNGLCDDASIPAYSEGNIPLISLAITKDAKNIFDYLLEKKVDLNRVDSYGRSPAGIATSAWISNSYYADELYKAGAIRPEDKRTGVKSWNTPPSERNLG